ncbi:Bacterial non-heme ferritin [Geodia barretti]|jgi:ferritin|uniref:Ferritin n=1 Tax=Geodia barretti TaxID=519541 RepID=A0AA35SYW6_GEOBA|nr:Bacterial non-heme ferritin [Geodia barretti]
MAVSSSLQVAFNRHINAEFYSSYLYLSMSTYCDSIDLPGFSHWMRIQSQEEYDHAMRILTYLEDRDGRVTLLPIEQPAIEFDSVEDVMRQTLGHEQHVTQLINELYAVAAESADFASQVMLQWFVNEQVEEEKTARDVIAALDKVAGRSDALLLLDREMAARVPTPAAA